jgi:hypothetical protein
MSEVVREFVVATHELSKIRKEHAPNIKAHMVAKKASQLALYNHMDTRNVTCVAVSEGPLAGPFVRMKTNCSTRAITDEVIHVALHAVPDDVLTGNSLDESVDLILTEVQRARSVQRKYVAFDTSAKRGCEEVESPLIAEHATAYAQAIDGLKAARAARLFSWSTGGRGALNGDLRPIKALCGCGRPHIVSTVHAASLVAGRAVCRPRGGRQFHLTNKTFVPKDSYKRDGTLEA